MEDTERLTKLSDRLELTLSENDRLKDMIGRLKSQLAITELRLFVLTEINYFSRDSPNSNQLVMSCISALDEDNEWWMDREEYTMAEWADELNDYEVLC